MASCRRSYSPITHRGKIYFFAFLPGGKDKFDNSSQTTMKETRNEDLFTMKVRFSIRLELVSSYCEQLFEACP